MKNKRLFSISRMKKGLKFEIFTKTLYSIHVSRLRMLKQHSVKTIYADIHNITKKLSGSLFVLTSFSWFYLPVNLSYYTRPRLGKFVQIHNEAAAQTHGKRKDKEGHDERQKGSVLLLALLGKKIIHLKSWNSQRFGDS